MAIRTSIDCRQFRENQPQPRSVCFPQFSSGSLKSIFLVAPSHPRSSDTRITTSIRALENTPDDVVTTMISTKNSTGGPAAPGSSHRQAVPAPAHSRVVPRPVPQSQSRDARGYQIEQLRRRFSPQVVQAADGTTSLIFTLTPSDPDFPFDLAGLECELRVPAAYPKANPQLNVRNKDIPRGFGINIEKGWSRLAEEKRGATLLALTNALDKNLEAFLTEQKAETVKLTIIKNAKLQDDPATSAASEQASIPAAPKPTEPGRSYIPEASFTKDQIAEAKARRAQEVRQLEARMGRLPVYHKSIDGIIYTLPLEPRRRSDLPLGLQKVQTFQLIIPLLYPLQALRVLLNEVDSDADRVEELFMEKAAEQRQMSLTSHVNYLAANLHTLAKQALTPKVEAPKVEPPVAEVQEKNAELSATSEGARSHIKVIPRPPEWHTDHGEDSFDDDSYDSDTDDSGGAAVDIKEDPLLAASKVTATSSAAMQPVERGTALSFPSIQLHGIELLQISVLSVSVKCERCKTVNEIMGLKDGTEKRESCKKCATAMTARFRPEMVHQHSTRAGFIDFTGCTVADMLPR